MTPRVGSSKTIIPNAGNNGTVKSLTFDFNQDTVSVFDVGAIPIKFEGIGRVRCAIAGKIFQHMKSVGFCTHYLSHDVTAATMEVLPCDIPDIGQQYNGSVGRVLGVEILDRRVVTPKVLERINAGEIPLAKIEALLSGSLEVGARFNSVFVECSTKFESVDRYVSDDEVPALANVGSAYLEQSVWPVIRRMSDWKANFFKSAGFDCLDGKVEGAFVYNGGEFMFVDTISPDELRLIGPDGRSYDKDPVREWYKKTFPGWYKELIVAKEAFPADKTQWPPYPDVPPQVVIDDMLQRYAMVAEAIRAV